MKKLFSNMLAALGSVTANMGSQACIVFILDEPEMPESLVK